VRNEEWEMKWRNGRIEEFSNARMKWRIKYGK